MRGLGVNRDVTASPPMGDMPTHNPAASRNSPPRDQPKLTIAALAFTHTLRHTLRRTQKYNVKGPRNSRPAWWRRGRLQAMCLTVGTATANVLECEGAEEGMDSGV